MICELVAKFNNHRVKVYHLRVFLSLNIQAILNYSITKSFLCMRTNSKRVHRELYVSDKTNTDISSILLLFSLEWAQMHKIISK